MFVSYCDTCTCTVMKSERWTMKFFAKLFLLWFLLVAVDANEVTDFVGVNRLSDGEIETRVHYNGISAKETTVSNRNAVGIKLRQLTDGKHFIQLIYENETLQDCEYVRQRHKVMTFLNTFKNDLRDLITTSNITIRSLVGGPLPQAVSTWFDYPNLKKLCRQAHRKMKAKFANLKELDEDILRNRSRNPRHASSLLLPGTLWCGHLDSAKKYTDIGALSGTDRCCRKHDQCRRNIRGFTQKYNFFNPRPFTISHCFCDSRPKRGIYDLLRIPGTKWCGKGYSATKYTQLGGFSKTDMCCRRHDLACPVWIGGLETKYGYHNLRVNTLMHCSCDERFRACLKMVGSSDANIVGKIFFNMVQTQCFVLKPKKVCTKKSWWGSKCSKRKYVKRAVIRRNLSY